MWGFEPALSAVLVKDFFVEKGLNNILIPGFGYGRNAQIFINSGMKVSGIEISKTAIELAKKHFGQETTIYHGSVCDMPFDNLEYDGIFSYALIHLLSNDERVKFIKDCYAQLSENGYMVFVVLSKKADSYGRGRCVSKDQYEIYRGIKMYLYDEESIQEEFSDYGLSSIEEINESYPFYIIKCQKVKK